MPSSAQIGRHRSSRGATTRTGRQCGREHRTTIACRIGLWHLAIRRASSPIVLPGRSARTQLSLRAMYVARPTGRRLAVRAIDSRPGRIAWRLSWSHSSRARRRGRSSRRRRTTTPLVSGATKVARHRVLKPHRHRVRQRKGNGRWCVPTRQRVSINRRRRPGRNARSHRHQHPGQNATSRHRRPHGRSRRAYTRPIPAVPPRTTIPHTAAATTIPDAASAGPAEPPLSAILRERRGHIPGTVRSSPLHRYSPAIDRCSLATVRRDS